MPVKKAAKKAVRKKAVRKVVSKAAKSSAITKPKNITKPKKKSKANELLEKTSCPYCGKDGLTIGISKKTYNYSYFVECQHGKCLATGPRRATELGAVRAIDKFSGIPKEIKIDIFDLNPFDKD